MKGLKGSLIGNFIIAILLFKALVAYSLLTNRSYAIPIAKIDAISGIVIFLVATVLPFITYDPQHPNYRNFGFDILFLIPYLNIICKMKGWNLVKEE